MLVNIISKLTGEDGREEMETKVCGNRECVLSGQPQPIANFALRTRYGDLDGPRQSYCRTCVNKNNRKRTNVPADIHREHMDVEADIAYAARTIFEVIVDNEQWGLVNLIYPALEWAEKEYQAVQKDRLFDTWDRRRILKANTIKEPISASAVLRRDGPVCYLCGKPIKGKSHLDHVIPLSRGGSHTMNNLKPTHPSCNIAKSARMPWELDVPPALPWVGMDSTGRLYGSIEE